MHNTYKILYNSLYCSDNAAINITGGFDSFNRNMTKELYAFKRLKSKLNSKVYLIRELNIQGIGRSGGTY